MKDFDALIKRALNMVDTLRIERYPEITWQLSSTLLQKRHAHGRCRITRNPVTYEVTNYEITLDEFYLEDTTPDKATLSVMVHEILHTCPGCLNHGNKWKKYAKMCDNAYGIKSDGWSSTFEELGVNPPDWHVEERAKILASYDDYKWKVVCPKCGKKFGRYKRLSNAQKRILYELYCCHVMGVIEEITEEERDEWRNRLNQSAS